MSEQKRCKRIPVEIELSISDLFKQDNVKIKNNMNTNEQERV